MKRIRDVAIVLRRVPITVAAASCVVILAAANAAGAVIYVDAAAPGGAGTSWGDAYRYLQDALVGATSGDEVWVAEGTYAPDRGTGQTPGSRASTFSLQNGVAIYGGFSGTETQRDERDPAAHITILSGDLAGDDEPAWVNHGENAHHVLTGVSVNASAILDGFTVQGGYAETSSGWDGAGGALLLQSGSPTLNDCLFRENLAHLGAALIAAPGSPHVTRCFFEGNYAWIGRGGAVYHDNGSFPEYEDCHFANNLSYGASSVGDGGAMFNMTGAAVTLRRCVFLRNESSATGPPYSTGGAISSLGDGLTVIDCTFYGNTALEGGALWTGGDASIVNSVFSGNTSLFGGGIVVFLANVSLVNSDLSRNHADDGGGIACGYGGTVAVLNSVLWGNTATQAPSDFKAQVHKSDATSVADFRYSIVQGVFTPEPGEDPPDPADFPGCSEADPLFADDDGADNVVGTEDDDLQLLAGSPGIDAAENASVPAGITFDLAGAARFLDDPSTVDTGLGTPPIVDMGAYEFGGGVATSVAAHPFDAGAASQLFLAAPVARPNPFRRARSAAGEATVVSFSLSGLARVSVEVIDVAGRRVRKWRGAQLSEGRHTVIWDGRDEGGAPSPAGLYFVRVTAGGESRSVKVLLVP